MSPVIFTVDDPVFRSFAVCAGLLGAKLVLNSAWTVFNRVQRQVREKKKEDDEKSITRSQRAVSQMQL